MRVFGKVLRTVIPSNLLGGVMLALIVVGILGLFSCEKESVSEMERNKSQLREAESYDFSEIYKRFNDGSLKNYEDVKFVPKPKKEALQYVENVLNYLTGTPYKGSYNVIINIKIDFNNKDNQLDVKQEVGLVKEIVNRLIELKTNLPYFHVVAVDIDIKSIKKNNVNVNVLAKIKNNDNQKTNIVYDWSYIFPYSNTWVLNHQINNFWIGYDERASSCSDASCFNSYNTKNAKFYFPNDPACGIAYCLNNPANYYDALKVVQYKLNTSMGYYYTSFPSFSFFTDITGIQHLLDPNVACKPIRDTVQSLINKSRTFVIQGATQTHKVFIGCDLWYESQLNGGCGCACYKHKWVYGEYIFGNIRSSLGGAL